MCGVAARSVKNDCLSGVIGDSSCGTTYCLSRRSVTGCSSAVVLVLMAAVAVDLRLPGLPIQSNPWPGFPVETSFCFAAAERAELVCVV